MKTENKAGKEIDASQVYVIDTYVWYEYFIGSELGGKIRNLIENGKTATPSVVIAELVNKFTREGKPYKQFIEFLKLKSDVIFLDSEIAEISGILRTQFDKDKISMADAIVMATAQIKNLKIITVDGHFTNLRNAIIMK